MVFSFNLQKMSQQVWSCMGFYVAIEFSKSRIFYRYRGFSVATELVVIENSATYDRAGVRGLGE